MPVIEKRQLILIAICVLLIAAFLAVWYLPSKSKAEELEQAKLRLDSENQDVAVKIEQLPVLKKQIETKAGVVGDYDVKVPLGRSHGLFLQQIADVMSEHGLGDQLVQPGNEIKTDRLNCIPISIKCKGKLSRIFGFFQSLEEFDRVIQIENMQLTNSKEYDGQLEMQANANIYYRPLK